MTLAISGHGTLVARALAATPTMFTNIAELGDVTPPELMRNEFDATTQDKDIDNVVFGVMRRGDVTLALNFLPTDGSHDHVTGLYNAIITNSVDGYKFSMPQGLVWIASGQVKSLKPNAPVDGKLSLAAVLRFSGKMLINGVVIG